MRPIEDLERLSRNIGRNLIPSRARGRLWLYYMEAKRIAETGSLNRFASVHLEINTQCNRSCWYCTNHSFPKKPQYMEEGLYDKIISELAAIQYRGQISFNLSSEPTLHPDLPELIADARKIKKARLVLYTNGDFLNRRNFDRLKDAGIDHFIITQHGKSIPSGLSNLMDSLSGGERKTVRYQTLDGFRLFNRGIAGLIPESRRTIPNPCFVAQYDLSILVNGDIAQCCNDFRGENVFGNVHEKTIMEIWDDPKFKSFRNEVKEGQFNSDVCQRCVFDKLP